MELTLAKCESILNTLPIGYYTGRRIDVTLDEKEATSFYSPMEDKIVVSYPIIKERMSHMPEGSDEENAVRSMLYHEVSHAILTPQRMQAYDWLNIFEDERIESVLRNYYHNTDFKKQLYDLHGGKIPTPKTDMQAFYNAVRFGVAPQEILDEISKIIRKHKDKNRLTSSDDAYGYMNDVYNLYKKIAKDFRKTPTNYTPSASQAGGEQKDMDSIKQGEDGQGKGEQAQGGKPQNGEGEPQDGTGQAQDEGQEEGEENRGDSIGDPAHGVSTDISKLKEMIREALDDTNKLPEEYRQELEDFRKTAEMIIGNFNKKNKGGSGINAYSGVFNPRSVVRQDYRYFDRAMTTQGNNKFGTCHLNLFIDCSGSFWHSEKIMNGIIMVLTDIERKNRNFSMDISFINTRYTDCETIRDRVFHATGGNDIPADMKERFLKRQKPNTCNYNIVCFDGDAFSDCSARDGERKRRFSAFDYKQTTVITDDDNVCYMGKGFSSAKVVVTCNYTAELINHITKALTVAFG